MLSLFRRAATPPAAPVPPAEAELLAPFLSATLRRLEEIRGRRRLISLPPETLAALRRTLAEARRLAAPTGQRRLAAAAAELDAALAEIEADAAGYTQRFELRRLFGGFLDAATRTLAEIEAAEGGQIVRPADGQPLVLVVDDEPLVHRMVERAVGRAADVRGVTTCAAARAALAVERPDLVLLDVNLPDMRGTDFLRELKGDGAHAAIPVVMLSSSYDDQTVVSGLCAGAIDFLSKDLKILALRPRLVEILAHGRARLTGAA